MVKIFGVVLHAYGLLIGIGVYVAWEVARIWGGIEEKTLEKMLPGLVISGVVGARLYHVIDFWEYYSVNEKEIFYLWNGGLGIWGAIVGGSLFLASFAYIKKMNFLKLLDSVIIGVPLAQAIGRLGNWVNGELYGKNGEPLFAWEGGLNLILFGLLVYISRPGFRVGARNDKISTGGVYLVGYGLIRIFLENFRSDSIIWRIGGIPTAVIFGTVSVFVGIVLIQKRSANK